MEQLEKDFWKEVEAQGGKMYFDLNDPMHEAVFSKKLGRDKAVVASDYPMLAKAIENGKQYKVSSETNSNTNGRLPIENSDCMDITKINYDPNSITTVKSTAKYVKEKATIRIQTEIYDETHKDWPIFYDDDWVDDEYNFEIDSEIDSDNIQRHSDKTFKANVVYTWIDHEVKTESGQLKESGRLTDSEQSHGVLMKGYAKTETISVTSSNSKTIKDFKLIDPVTQQNDNKETVIVYNRAKMYKEDYEYSNVTVEEKVNNIEYINLRIPVKGTATFENSLRVTEVLMDNSEIHVETIGVSGVTNFNKATKWNDIKFTYYENEPRVDWEFPVFWDHLHPKGGFTGAAGLPLSFYCKLVFRLKKKGVDFNTTTVIFDSNYVEKSNSSNTKYVKPLRLYWGCFGKNSKVAMSGGDEKEKRIAEIKIGESVMTDSGSAVVKNIVTGEEEIMICIRTVGGKELLLTKEHPVMTERGIVSAGSINAADKVKTIDSQCEDIEMVYPVEYNDEVYSLILDNESYIYANGILTGDFDAQQHSMGAEAEACMPKTKLALTSDTLQARVQLKDLIQKVKGGDNH